MSTLQQKNRKLVRNLILIVFLMFAFAFALIPLYNVMCKTLGINGKPNMAAINAEVVSKQDMSRTIRIEFDTTLNEQLKWEFRPLQKTADLHPGGVIQTGYYAKNLTDKTMTIQAIPSVTPGKAAKYIRKLECFCFTSQTLGPHESADLPLTFILEAEIPEDVHTLTLSYTLFDVTDSPT
ncbi:MAG: cytochrome c oxidase assembly protein [Pseudomonadota bacterium]